MLNNTVSELLQNCHAPSIPAVDFFHYDGMNRGLDIHSVFFLFYKSLSLPESNCDGSGREPIRLGRITSARTC